MSALDRILSLYEKLPENVDNPVSKARALFPFYEPKVADEKVFFRVITLFVQHMDKLLMHGAKDDGFSYSSARNMLEQANREEGGFVGAGENAISGHNGGMQRVIHSISEYYRQDLTRNYIIHIVDSNVSPSDFDEQMNLVQEFLNRFGHLLPVDFKKKSAAQLAPKYKDLLMGYLSSVRKIKSAIYKP